MTTEAMSSETGRGLRADARRNVEAILEAARAALAEDPQTSMGQIAARAGVHRATVHRHFAAREDLVRALHERAREAAAEAAGAADREGASPRERLHELTGAWARIAGHFRLQDQGVLLGDDGEHGRVVALLEEGARSGELRDDVEASSLVVLWAGMVVAGGRLAGDGTRTPEQVADDVVRLLAG